MEFEIHSGQDYDGLVLAAMIGGMEAAPALAKDDHKRVENMTTDVTRPEDMGMTAAAMCMAGEVGLWLGDGYVPPPVVYAPAPAPGISIFFPPIIIH